MALFALFLSSFATAASVIPAGVGIPGLSVGFIFVATPIISAATRETTSSPGMTTVGFQADVSTGCDAFLAMAVVAVLALIVVFRMRPAASVRGGQSSPSRSAQSSSVSSE